MAAIVAIKVMKERKVRSTASSAEIPTQESAPSIKRDSFITQFKGTVTPLTKITANPRPIEASIFLDIAKNEHIPKK
jgi:hypothetical protein